MRPKVQIHASAYTVLDIARQHQRYDEPDECQDRHKSKKSQSLVKTDPLQPVDLQRKFLARLAGFEPTTPWFVAKYSIQLSYSREAAQYSSPKQEPGQT